MWDHENKWRKTKNIYKQKKVTAWFCITSYTPQQKDFSPPLVPKDSETDFW